MMGVFIPQKLANAQISPAPFPIHQQATVFNYLKRMMNEKLIKVLTYAHQKAFLPKEGLKPLVSPSYESFNSLLCSVHGPGRDSHSAWPGLSVLLPWLGWNPVFNWDHSPSFPCWFPHFHTTYLWLFSSLQASHMLTLWLAHQTYSPLSLWLLLPHEWPQYLLTSAGST